MSYASLIEKHPDIQRLFERICTLVNDEGREPAELLPDAVKWLRERIREPEELQEAIGRVQRYLKYLGDKP